MKKNANLDSKLSFYQKGQPGQTHYFSRAGPPPPPPPPSEQENEMTRQHRVHSGMLMLYCRLSGHE